MNAMDRSIEKPPRSLYAAVLFVCVGLLVGLAACGAEDEQPAPSPGPASSAAPPVVDSAPARSTQDVDPTTTGTISGQVISTGVAAPRQALPVVGEAYCMGVAQEGAGLLSESLMVTDGRLAGAFVWIREGLDDWRFPRAEGSVDLDQRGCTYVPHVLGVRKGQTVRVINSDPVLHNVHSVGKANGEKNLAMPFEGQVIQMKFKRSEVMVQLNCDVHAWMRSYVGVVEHPCFDVSGSDGTFTLGSVPPGDYVVGLWHETLGSTEFAVTVSAGETVDLGELSF